MLALVSAFDQASGRASRPNNIPGCVNDLLADFYGFGQVSSRPPAVGEIFHFELPPPDEKGTYRVYNIGPVPNEVGVDSLERIVARVERTELESEVWFFRRSHIAPNQWVRDTELVDHTGQPLAFAGQDPRIFRIGNFYVLSFVEVQHTGVNPVTGRPTVRWRLQFWMGHTLGSLKLKSYGPWGMKGVVLGDLGNGFVLRLGRPMGGKKSGKGKISAKVVYARSMRALARQLSPARLQWAPLIPGLCGPGEWVGANGVEAIGTMPAALPAWRSRLEYVLRFGSGAFLWPMARRWLGGRASLEQVRITAHIGERLGGNRRYSATEADYDLSQTYGRRIGRILRYRITAMKQPSFPGVKPAPEQPDLEAVLYPSRAVRCPDGKRRLLAGISDNAAGWVEIDDPEVAVMGLPRPAAQLTESQLSVLAA